MEKELLRKFIRQAINEIFEQGGKESLVSKQTAMPLEEQIFGTQVENNKHGDEK